jgi:hypothetical protein
VRAAFVLVNGRTPSPQKFCMQCCERITSGYLREVGTRLLYCDYGCYSLYCERAPILESLTRAASWEFAWSNDGAKKTPGPGQVGS